MEGKLGPFVISTLIAKSVAGEVTDEEQVELQRWLDASPENRNIYNQILNPAYKQERDEFLKTIDASADWERVRAAAFAPKKGKQTWFSAYRIAAAIALVCAASFGLYTLLRNQDATPSFEEQVALIQPGQSQAIVKLHNGQTIVLSDSTNINKTFSEANGTSLRNTQGALSYEADASSSDELIYNEVFVPRGGEYKLVLADGTKVWLNSETELTFPVKFASNERVVELTGEAFFEVAHDSKRPFIVNTPHEGKVQVYGTAFNVNSYEENNNVIVTLNEGKVSLRKANGSETLLKPDDQALLLKDSEMIKVTRVDASQFSAWRNGLLVFDNLSMEEISKLLSRWYNVDFEFDKEKLKHYRFTADIKRYGSFRDVLRFFEKTNQFEFQIEGKVIRVGEKKDG